MKTIEELAREAGLRVDSGGYQWGEPFHIDNLARFAALVAAECAHLAAHCHTITMTDDSAESAAMRDALIAEMAKRNAEALAAAFPMPKE